jgi:hypothetical protein
MILYLTNTCLDIAFDVNMCSKYMKEPHESHGQDAKCILFNLKGMTHMSIHYLVNTPIILHGFPMLVGLVILVGGNPLLATY